MQFFLYLIVGGLSFVVDIGVFVLLRMADIAVIPASVISFIAATSVNYLLSIALAFQSRRFRRHIELVRFLAVVFVGLALNTMLVCLFVAPAVAADSGGISDHGAAGGCAQPVPAGAGGRDLTRVNWHQ